ncbi:MAG: thioredoxin domain-containing protein [Bacteroidales bacterium]|jgi:uncharacterized protein YyaL (SSP411 family)|nr:thioredoxin domain-containing protein [Bacteroidales bacterium]
MMPDHRFTNQLIRESSPYLLQHAHNPVEWHPWNEQTLSKARSLDKMLLISIGYSSCHWCHVMERESFEDVKVAEIMNRNFICIKVDREERPDVDQVYMNAVQLITGSGGWPLNCFALPDGRPFFGGTYFRKNQWVQLLENISTLYLKRRKEIEDQADALTEGIRKASLIKPAESVRAITREDITRITNNLTGQMDELEGGFGGAPKFPMPAALAFLLTTGEITANEKVEKLVKLTLRKMSYGGIYDQAGGGFARYSTDSQWKVPHFEKMLYDNAQLASLYLEASQVYGSKEFRETAEETLGFIMREMTSPEGGFYSALDADSEGKEGRFYTWTAGELKVLTGNQGDLVRKYYHTGGKGMWEEGQNILVRTQSPDEFARAQGLQPSAFKTILKTAKAKLLKERNKRARPGLDNKVLASWNGLMMKAFADAGRITGQKKYLEAAVKNAGFINATMTGADGRLFHCFSKGKSYINGFLEDYCFVAEGMLALYQATFSEQYLHRSLELIETAIRDFYNAQSGYFFGSSASDAPLVARQQEIYDSVIPSSNSITAGLLYKLGVIFEKDDFIEKHEKMVSGIREKALQFPSAFANWASVMLLTAFPYHFVVITGDDYPEKIATIRKHFHSQIFFCAARERSELPVFRDRFNEGQTMIYICTGRECLLPTTSVDEALQQLAGKIRLTPE